MEIYTLVSILISFRDGPSAASIAAGLELVTPVVNVNILKNVPQLEQIVKNSVMKSRTLPSKWIAVCSEIWYIASTCRLAELSS